MRGPKATLETDRFILPRGAPSANAVFRKLWVERDPRAPRNRRVGEGRHPTEPHVAAQILAAANVAWTQLLTDRGRAGGAPRRLVRS